MTTTQKRTTKMRIIIIMSNEDENDWTRIRVKDKMTYDTSTTMRRQWRRGAKTMEKDERKNNE